MNPLKEIVTITFSANGFINDNPSIEGFVAFSHYLLLKKILKRYNLISLRQYDMKKLRLALRK